MLLQKNFTLLGHKNIVSLSVTKINASENIRGIDPVQRNCLFPDENQSLKMHKSYTQSNCYLECYLFNGQVKLAKNQNLTYNCTPWYLPFHESSLVFCDPWEAIQLNDIMFNNIDLDKMCSHCLPDCSTAIYHPVLTSIPFRTCDDSNLGVSGLCNLEDKTLPEPRIWGKQVREEYSGTMPAFVQSIESSQRTIQRNHYIFPKQKKTYDAYEKDIAVLQVSISPTFYEQHFRTKVF